MSTPQWQRNRVAVSASASGVWLGNTLVLPFLPTFVAQLGVEGTASIAFWSGILFAVSPALAAVSGPVWGKIGDRYGLRIVTARAAAGNSICWLLMAFAADIWQVLLIRLMLGILGGFNSISVAAITQLTPRNETARVIGGLQSTQILSAAVGPLVGGILSQSIGIRNTFFATTLITFGSFISILLLYRDRPHNPGSGEGSDEATGGAYWKRTDYLLPMAILFSIQMTDRTYTPVVPLFLERLGTPPTRLALVAGALFSSAALGEAFSAWLSGRLASRMHPKRLLLARLSLGLVCLVPLALAASPSAFFVWRIMVALLAGGILTLAFTAAGEVIPGDERGAAYSLLSSTLMLGGSAGPVVAGVLARFGLRTVFMFNIGVYLLLTAVVLRSLRHEGQETTTHSWDA